MAKTKPPELEYIIVVETSRVLLQERVNYYIGAVMCQRAELRSCRCACHLRV